MNTAPITTLLLCAGFVLSASAQELLRNGSFESPAIPELIGFGQGFGQSAQTAPTGWTWGTGSTLEASIVRAPGGQVNGYPPAKDGAQYVDLGGLLNTGVSQTFAVGNPDLYTLTWFDNHRDQPRSGDLPFYSVTILTGLADVTEETQTITNRYFTIYPQARGAWVRRSMELKLTPGVYTLRFRLEVPAFGSDPLIDHVTLERPPDEDLVTTIHVSAVNICWPGRTNYQYQVQYSTELPSTNWVDLGGPIVGTGTNCVTDSVDGAQYKSYRVIRLP